MLMSNLEKVAMLGSGWVLYLLLALSVASIGIMIERYVYFRKHRGHDHDLGDHLVARLREGDRRGAEELLLRDGTIEGEVLATTLDWIDGGPDAVAEALAAHMQKKRRELERGLTFLGTLGNNAPFVGLLGTVIGVIQAFHQLGQGGAGQNTSAMGNVMVGISEALIATGVGLLVALPAVVGFNITQKRVADIESNVDVIGKQLLAFLKSEAKMIRDFRLLDEPPPPTDSTPGPAPVKPAPSAARSANGSRAKALELDS